MLPRIQGATLPSATITVTDDQGAVITDGLSYTWQCQASTQLAPGTAATQLWVKTTGITPTATGFTCAWLAADIGALVATNSRPAKYTLEFTGTFGTSILKHQETVTITPEIP